MKYTQSFIKSLSDIESLTLLEKELDYVEHLESHVRKLQFICGENDALYRQYDQELNKYQKKKENLERKIATITSRPLKPHEKLSRYMEVYQLSPISISSSTSVSPTTIQSYLDKGTIEEETHQFILWGIQQFRLPAEEFLNDITSSLQYVRVRRANMLSI